jgi:cytochrome c oxidase subunit 4
MDTGKTEGHLVGYGTYILVWLALLVLTGLTVTAAGMRFGALNIIAVLAIAGAKASLVLYFFMHLKYEGALLRFIFLTSMIVLVIIIGLTYLEVLFR